LLENGTIKGQYGEKEAGLKFSGDMGKECVNPEYNALRKKNIPILRGSIDFI